MFVALKLGLAGSLPTSYPGLFSHSSNQYQRISASQAWWCTQSTPALEAEAGGPKIPG